MITIQNCHFTKSKESATAAENWITFPTSVQKNKPKNQWYIHKLKDGKGKQFLQAQTTVNKATNPKTSISKSSSNIEKTSQNKLMGWTAWTGVHVAKLSYIPTCLSNIDLL